MHPMEETHVDDVCRLHLAAMGNSLWARLGPVFLRQLYQTLIKNPDFIGLVYVEDDRTRGFIAGSSNGPQMMRRTLGRHALSLGSAALRGVLRRPNVTWPLLETLRYFGKSSVAGTEDIVAESMFCSFEPELRGKRISGLINKLLFDELARRGAHFVKITTEVDNAGAARQLTSWGFERAGEFRFYGKAMVTWILNLDACERVES
jgi:ribosomal protein S18 acetylase RimI-like enzyme